MSEAKHETYQPPLPSPFTWFGQNIAIVIIALPATVNLAAGKFYFQNLVLSPSPYFGLTLAITIVANLADQLCLRPTSVLQFCVAADRRFLQFYPFTLAHKKLFCANFINVFEGLRQGPSRKVIKGFEYKVFKGESGGKNLAAHSRQIFFLQRLTLLVGH